MQCKSITNVALGFRFCQHFLVGHRRLLGTGQRSHANSVGEEVRSAGGHPDRTTLEGDIYDDTADLEAARRSHESHEHDQEQEMELKRRLLCASLRFVPQHGWSKKALVAGASAEGLPPLTHGLVSRGPIELVHHFYDSANQNLANKLAKDVEDVERGITEKKRVTLFIRDAVIYRLNLLTPYLDTWPQAMGLMALPQNVPESLKHLGHLVDDIWYYAGDRSTDFNWYTKRVTLAAAYQSTALHMIQDKSVDFDDTWTFLDRRLKNLGTVGKGVKQMQDNSSSFGNFLQGSYIMARNMLGVNDRRR